MVQGGLTLRARREGEVLVIVVSGLMTFNSAGNVRRFIFDELQREDARAVVCDMRGCVQAIGPPEWNVIAAHAVEADDRVSVPVAFVVSEAELKPIDALCDRLTDYGLFRVADTRFSAAFTWASECREHWAFAPLATRVSSGSA